MPASTCSSWHYSIHSDGPLFSGTAGQSTAAPPVVLRVQRAGVVCSRRPAAYPRKRCCLFRKQQGFLGVFFLGKQKDRAVLTIWKDKSSVGALAHSSTYQETSTQLGATGILVGKTSVEVFEVQEGALNFFPRVVS